MTGFQLSDNATDLVSGGEMLVRAVILLIVGLPKPSRILMSSDKGRTLGAQIKLIWNLLMYITVCFLTGSSASLLVLRFYFQEKDGGDFQGVHLLASLAIGVLAAVFGLLTYGFVVFCAAAYTGAVIGIIISTALDYATDMKRNEYDKLLTELIALVCGCICFIASKQTKAFILPVMWRAVGSIVLTQSLFCISEWRSAVMPLVFFIPESDPVNCGTSAQGTDVFIFAGSAGTLLVGSLALWFVVGRAIRWYESLQPGPRGYHRIDENNCDNEEGGEGEAVAGESAKSAVKLKKKCNGRNKDKAVEDDGAGVYTIVTADGDVPRAEYGGSERRSKKSREIVSDEEEEEEGSGVDEGDDVAVDEDVGQGNELARDASDREDEAEGSDSDNNSEASSSSASSSSASSSSSSGSTSRSRPNVSTDWRREAERVAELKRRMTTVIEEKRTPNGDSLPPPGVEDWTVGDTDYEVDGVRIVSTRLVSGVSAGWGLGWLIWLCVAGFNASSFIGAISATFFVAAEAINWFLGMVYNANFWTTIKRKRKSLRSMPGFEAIGGLLTGLCIYHYAEPPEETGSTMAGALTMHFPDNLDLLLKICDDSFWQKASNSDGSNTSSKMKKFAGWLSYLDPVRCCKKKRDDDEEEQPEDRNKKDDLPKLGEVPDIVNKALRELPKPHQTYLRDLLQDVAQRFGVIPSKDGLAMIKEVHRVLFKAYGEDHDIVLRPVLNDSVRHQDCALASFEIHFDLNPRVSSAKQASPHKSRMEKELDAKEGHDKPRPREVTKSQAIDAQRVRVSIVARIKPPVHHSKAGNANNALYHTDIKKCDYMIFLDNDMRPEPDFLVHTLPWFYKLAPSRSRQKRWQLKEHVAFVQTPQVFSSGICNGDKLGNENKIFFDAIQPGRDGVNACAFAGTGAIFQVRALRRIGGIPYGSATEDAHTSIRLHRVGYTSVYVNIPLVIGSAPTTVAARLLQFLRWVKGSIQLWWALSSVQRACSRELVDAPANERPNPFLLQMFALDSMTWPLSAISALVYMLCAVIFVFFGEAPVHPDQARYLAFVFLPYFALKMLNNWIGLWEVKASSIWVAQEVWYSQAFTALLGILDAFCERLFGKGLSTWRATGVLNSTTNIEWFNILVFICLVFGIIIQSVLFFEVPSHRSTAVGSIVFAGVILIQLWPTVSMSLFERTVNRFLPRHLRVQAGRFRFPNWFIFTVLLVLALVVGPRVSLDELC